MIGWLTTMTPEQSSLLIGYFAGTLVTVCAYLGR